MGGGRYTHFPLIFVVVKNRPKNSVLGTKNSVRKGAGSTPSFRNFFASFPSVNRGGGDTPLGDEFHVSVFFSSDDVG